MLSSINSIQKRIITVEEPVEYELRGTQSDRVVTAGKIGLTFAMGLRHILRQDPNVIMVKVRCAILKPRKSPFARR